MRTILLVIVAMFAYPARADIYQWEYIDTADPGQGKRRSSTLAPDGADVDAFRGANLSNRDLTKAYLIGADFTPLYWFPSNCGICPPRQIISNLSGVNLTDADLTAANLGRANLNGAIFVGAEVRGASFRASSTISGYPVGGISLAQLYSTASYRTRDLSGIDLGANFDPQLRPFRPNYAGAEFGNQNFQDASFIWTDLAGANFRRANLMNVDFSLATLTEADFTDADLRGANFNRADEGNGISLEQIYSSASYRGHDLSGIRLPSYELGGASFASQNLTDADFQYSTLTDANFRYANLTNANLVAVLSGTDFSGAVLSDTNFTNADIRGASFAPIESGFRSGTGITLAQLYSTGSYQAHDLGAVRLSGHDLTNANFSDQNLTNADFGFSILNLTTPLFAPANLTGANLTNAYVTNASFNGATLTRADFTGADARGARFHPADATDTNFTNFVQPDGHINGVDLSAGALLAVRDYDGDLRYEPVSPPIPVTVDQHLAMGAGGTLRLLFEADVWDSTISFAPGIPVTLGGTLELTFAADVNPTSQIGRTFDLFDWAGVDPTGTFAVSSAYRWNLANLYTSGEVTMVAVPESSTVLLMTIALLVLGTASHR